MNENYQVGLETESKRTAQSELIAMRNIINSIEDKLLYINSKEPSKADSMPTVGNKVDDFILQIEDINQRLAIISEILQKLGLYNN